MWSSSLGTDGCVCRLSVFSSPLSLAFPVYRGFWAVLMLLGVVAVVSASFLIICAAPFSSHLLYKAGGGSYVAAGRCQSQDWVHSLGFLRNFMAPSCRLGSLLQSCSLWRHQCSYPISGQSCLPALQRLPVHMLASATM